MPGHQPYRKICLYIGPGFSLLAANFLMSCNTDKIYHCKHIFQGWKLHSQHCAAIIIHISRKKFKSHLKICLNSFSPFSVQTLVVSILSESLTLGPRKSRTVHCLSCIVCVHIVCVSSSPLSRLASILCASVTFLYPLFC